MIPTIAVLRIDRLCPTRARTRDTARDADDRDLLALELAWAGLTIREMRYALSLLTSPGRRDVDPDVVREMARDLTSCVFNSLALDARLAAEGGAQ